MEMSEKTGDTFSYALRSVNSVPRKLSRSVQVLCRSLLICILILPVLHGSVTIGAPVSIALDLKTRNSSGQATIARQTFLPSQLAILVIDVWDSHPDPEMASRISALIPRMNQTLDAARRLGISVIFCPNEVPLPRGADTNIFKTLPNQPQINNGFNPPGSTVQQISLGRHGSDFVRVGSSPAVCTLDASTSGPDCPTGRPCQFKPPADL
ncbi:MAG TPA: hypothetical protein VFW05_02235 [Verrucomicrobiae bacterium]|nr:hypothetical protein [Verrucomicrobiae bacterium]